MTRIKTTIVMLTAVAISALVGQVQADEYYHINSLAQDIETKSKLLHREMVNFRHVPQYRYVRSDALELKRLSRQIHKFARNEGNIFELESCLDELAVVYQHTAELVDQIDFETTRGYGQTAGTCLVQDLMVDLEDCIYQMRADVAVIRNRTLRRAPIRVSNRATYARPAYVAPRPTVVVKTRPAYVPPRSTYVPRSYAGAKRVTVAGKNRAPNVSKYGNVKGRGRVSGPSRSGVTIGSGGFRLNINF